MNQGDREKWLARNLAVVLDAMAGSSELSSALVFKGAWILNRLLGDATRQSFDLDSNMTPEFQDRHPEGAERQSWLRERIERALRDHFERMTPVTLSLRVVRVDPLPRRGHPQGWDGFRVEIGIDDLSRPGTRSFPLVTVDAAAPEPLTPGSTAPLRAGGGFVTAYTLERIAAEKLRAFLTTLPPYREKMRLPPRPIRAKDLQDLARILHARPLDAAPFWATAGTEFRAACSGRYVDCAGWISFEPFEKDAADAWARDTTLPPRPTFADGWAAARGVIEAFAEAGLFPIWSAIPLT